MIEVKNLEKSFGEQKVLNDVSLVCPNGEITGIIGHNGSGKTVLFKCICGLLFEDSGEILIDGKRYKSGGELIKNAGIIIENPAFPRGTLKGLAILGSLYLNIIAAIAINTMQNINKNRML